MRKKAAAPFCGDCGYEFTRDETGECRMCARFEQLRVESAVLRPSELASRQTPSAEPIDISDPVPSIEWPPTPSEYRAILAERRARTPSADGQSREPAATVIGTLALGRPANSGMETPTAGSAGESPASPKKKSTARRKSPSPAPPKKKSTARRKSRPAAAPSPDGPTPMLNRPRAPQQPANVTRQAPTATQAVEPPARAEKSSPPRESPTVPTRDYVPSFSAGVKETETLAVPDAHRIRRARRVGRQAAGSNQSYPWKISFWVAVGGGLVAASVALLSTMIR